MEKQIKAVVVGAGDRGDIYASVSLSNPEKLKIVGVVDPSEVRRKIVSDKYNIPAENQFVSVEDFVKREKFADVVINGTMDHLHIVTSVPVLEKGYDLLLEKPFALNTEEVRILCETAKKYNNKVIIGHVLRYTEFYKRIKQHILNGDIGDVISIDMCENVNYHHMAVSYVRGKWRSEKVCFAPMLLAKSCHDIDIMMWMMNKTTPVAVSSFGSDFQYGLKNKPENAGHKCLVDCPLEVECAYSAKANYLTMGRWRHYVWRCIEGEEEYNNIDFRQKSLETDNPFGECVWDFERDGNVDHQTVIVNFANGATGCFSMVGGSAKSERNIHIIGTKGEIKGTFEDSYYVIRQRDPLAHNGYTEKAYDLKIEGDKTGENGAHGGGDYNMVIDFLSYVNGEEPSISCTNLEDSKISHLVVFKAIEAKTNNNIQKIELE